MQYLQLKPSSRPSPLTRMADAERHLRHWGLAHVAERHGLRISAESGEIR